MSPCTVGYDVRAVPSSQKEKVEGKFQFGEEKKEVKGEIRERRLDAGVHTLPILG